MNGRRRSGPERANSKTYMLTSKGYLLETVCHRTSNSGLSITVRSQETAKIELEFFKSFILSSFFTTPLANIKISISIFKFGMRMDK